ncbi:PH domain-containing protein [Hymenobacter sp. NST-14]|uniref:PH domain-containing protein n=1 Tax=Hymenobacter piscis TaxID=2839984 RepID=UPI001C01F987|nr:PH domain-containing protein [Hymenobacter piscis]MBT9392728.1 PH domain-containing protein [Hymenobacter piscis]
MSQIFPSKVSWWLFGPIIAFLLGQGIYAAVKQVWPQVLTSLTVLGIFYWLLRYTYYEVQPDQQNLRIVSGPMVWQVPVTTITSITTTHNPLSSPALSLDRLRVRYGTSDAVLISPADKAGLLAALRALNPAIRYE